MGPGGLAGYGELGDALDVVDVALIVQGPRSEILYANRAALALLGRERDEIIGVTSYDPGWDVILPDGSPFPPQQRPVARVLATGAPQRDVVMGVRRPQDDDRVWLLVDAVPRVGADGHRQVVITLSNITGEWHRLSVLEEVKSQLEQAVARRTRQLDAAELRLRQVTSEHRAVQQALAEKEQLYESVVNAMAEGVAVHEPTGAIRAANRAAEEILGLTADQMYGRDAIDPRWQLIDVDGRPLAPEQIPSEITQRTGEPCHNTLLGVHRPDGELAWLRISTVPLPGAGGGSPRGVVATFADVTAEREAQLEVERSRARFQRVTEAVPGVLFQLRQTGELLRFEFLSARASELLGVSPAAGLADADRVWQRLHPDDLLEVRAQLIANQGAEVWEHEVRVDDATRTWRWLRIRAVPQPIADGVVWNGVIVDVTEERRLGEQLRHTQRRELMGDLAAGVAHNFNNVLAVILPNLDECRREAPAALRPLLDDAASAARTAAELVRQLLQFARPAAPGPREVVDAGDIVRQVQALCQRSFDRRIDIDARIRVRDALLYTQAAELHQVLLNLCINARDALEDTLEPRVLLDVSQAAGTVVLRVVDNGCGMSPAIVERLGEPFFTTKEPGRGTGLGLATAFASIRRLGGTMECHSAPGEGTTFTIRLPAAVSRPRPVRTATEQHHFAGQRVLIIDDEPMVRRALARILRRRGLVPLEAADGKAGLDRVRASGGEIELVLLDLSMPAMSGDRVLVHLRELDAALPVIVLSGHVADASRLAHPTAVLTKPVTHDELIAAVTEALAKGAARDVG